MGNLETAMSLEHAALVLIFSAWTTLLLLAMRGRPALSTPKLISATYFTGSVTGLVLLVQCDLIETAVYAQLFVLATLLAPLPMGAYAIGRRAARARPLQGGTDKA